ncbi:MAG: hypothetical protein K0Q94_3500 [Paenibacillus sp.]|jgi:hypothetical protein|nr:hypothetical protein [Paenibacillus sp.]
MRIGACPGANEQEGIRAPAYDIAISVPVLPFADEFRGISDRLVFR